MAQGGTETKFSKLLPPGVGVVSETNTDDGYIVDFNIYAADRSVPSVVRFVNGRTEELVIRLPSLPKSVWTEEEVERRVRSIASTVGLSDSEVTIHPGLRRKPRKSSLNPDKTWYPHLQVDASLTEAEAARVVARVVDRME